MKAKILALVGACLIPAFPALAAELLDVKPVVSGSNVVIEVTADIPMTYTYYKVPGQARAVVDIADADPEKVEPLIVVNKGAVASISVDKAMIGDMTVSRLVFNLVSESDISVSHAPDRKNLTVSFGAGSAAPAAPAAKPAEVVATPVPVPVVVPEVKASVAAPSKPVSKEDDDPLGLDEPQPAAVPVSAPARSPKLEPVVPAASAQPVSAGVEVKGIVIGASFVDIQTNSPVETFKQLKLSKPERLSIEFPGTSTMRSSSIPVKRFGIAKVRVGTTPGLVRVVFDAAKSAFPRYEIETAENGLRVNFK